MKLAIAISLLVLGCGSRPNRACILAENALEQAHKEGTCKPVSFGETVDTAELWFDGGKRLCHDVLAHGPKEGPLSCDVMVPTKDELAASAKATAEAEAKQKFEADAKAKVDAETKARADAATPIQQGTVTPAIMTTPLATTPKAAKP